MPNVVKCNFNGLLHFRGKHWNGLQNYWQCPVCKRKGYLSIYEDDMQEMCRMLHDHYREFGW